ncbi:NlpC/P60 family protein [Arthrobacter sp. AOP36-A1-22]|uniref:NlpC/P60 family protein n=1 Tax=Arthrobacter sp. AOP36-A1-22 TaxID=3457684 RepID=UPI00403478EA
MAKGQFLGVATCTVALIGGTLMTGGAATAAPVDTTINSSAFGNTFAASVPTDRTLPSKAEVTAAKKDPAALKAMVSDIEDLIGDSTRELTDAEASAANDQDAYETTSQTLAKRNEAAAAASTEAAKATKYYDSVKKQVGQLASDLYRNGGVNPGITSLVNDSEHNDVLYKAATMNTLATNRSNTLTTAQQAASLWADWQNYADAAETAATEAADANETALQAAERTRTAYADRVTEQKKLRSELIDQLAYLRDTERADEAKRITAMEDAQREEALQTELATAPAEPAAQEPAEEPQALAAAPEAVPDEATGNTSLAPQTKTTKPSQAPVAAQAPATDPKPVAASTPSPVKAAPREPANTKTSEPKPAAPAASNSGPTTAQKKAAAHKRAQEQAAAKKARSEAAQAAANKKATAAAERRAQAAADRRAQQKAAADKKAREKAAAAKRAKEKAAAEAAQSSSGSSKESAIAWALGTASDNSKGYVFGANGPNSYDCSSFAQRAFAKSGISLPRTSSQQYFAGGTKVPLSQLKRGDLVFSTSNGGASFYHVAIYLGGGQVVHARNPSAGISTTPLSWVNNIYSYGVRY